MKRIELKKVLGKAGMLFLFLVFSLISVQDLAAQNYVDNAEAQDILQTELQEIANTYYFFQGNPANKAHQMEGLVIFTYKMVLQELINGATVEDAIGKSPLTPVGVISSTATSPNVSKGGVLDNWERADVAVSSIGDSDVTIIMNDLVALLSN